MFAIGALAYFDIIGVSTLIFIVIYTASFMMSWGPICWVLISEIFPNTIRGKAVAIAVAAQWISNFAVSATFPVLTSVSMTFTYSLYGAMSVLSAIFVWKMVPETKGKNPGRYDQTLEQEKIGILHKGRKSRTELSDSVRLFFYILFVAFIFR